MAGRFSNLELNQKQPQEAKAEVQAKPQALRAKRSPDAMKLMTSAIEEMRWARYEPALRLYTRALHEDRGLIPAWVGQVQMLVQLGELREARLWSDKALEVFRDNGELLAAKAQAAARLADRRAALSCSDASVAAPGSSPWRWQARGEVLLATKARHAAECFERALLEPAANWFDQVIIAGIYTFYDRTTNAIGHLKKALELEASNGHVWFQLGTCQARLAMAGPARVSFQHCLDLAPDFRPAGEALERLREGESAWASLRGLLRRGLRR